MRSKKILYHYYFFVLLSLNSCNLFLIEQRNRPKDYTSYVNVFTGTGQHGNTTPAAGLPLSLVKPGPDNNPYLNQENDMLKYRLNSGYHYEQSTISGFSNTHLSGSVFPELMDIAIIPSIVPLKLFKGTEDFIQHHSLKFSHDNEKACPGYYAVKTENGIKAELTSTLRCGIHRYYFPRTDDNNILINLGHTGWFEKIMHAHMKILNDSTIEGYRISDGMIPRQEVYFVIRMSKPFDSYLCLDERNRLHASNQIQGKNIKLRMKYDHLKDSMIMLKIAISSVSSENALMNLKKEIPGWNFYFTRDKAFQQWNEYLGRIHIESTVTIKKIFYTAMFHTLQSPMVLNDINNEYRGADGNIQTADDYQMYSSFPVWYSHRALHPLISLIYPGKYRDYMESLLTHSNHSKSVISFPLWGKETGAFNVDHSAVLIANAYRKGIIDSSFLVKFYDSVYTKHIYPEDNNTLNESIKNSYSPVHLSTKDPVTQSSLSKIPQEAYKNWCLAQIARILNKDDDYEELMARSESHKKTYGHIVEKMRSKNTNTISSNTINTIEKKQIQEIKKWSPEEYAFYMVHDIEWLTELFCGKENLEKKLDSIFMKGLNNHVNINSGKSEFSYNHDNIIYHHLMYLYNDLDKPWKTQFLVRQVMQKLYSTNIDGIPANDYYGHTSAWYVFSALGFYPVNPCSSYYVLGSPLIEKAEINIGSKKLIIKVHNQHQENYYIQSLKLNGKEYHELQFSQDELMKGGKLEFFMGEKPNKTWFIHE